MYTEPQSRKVKYEAGGINRIDSPGRVTLLVLGGGVVLILLVLTVLSLIRRAVERRRTKQAKGKV